MTMPLPREYTDGAPLHRALAIEDVELREETGDFHVAGRLAPYGVRAEIGPGVTEEFLPGTFARATRAPGRIKFRSPGTGLGHDNAFVVGHATSLEDRPDGIWGDFRIVDTSAGIDTAKLLRRGPNGEAPILDELSIEFVAKPGQFEVHREGKGFFIQHRSARLVAVAPVPVGAYGRDALVTQARSLQSAERDAFLTKLRSLRAGEKR